MRTANPTRDRSRWLSIALARTLDYVVLSPMHENDEELREIKREIIESRGLVIKTNNLTNALSADIKSIAKRQQTYERRLSWNSATAYLVFVFVVFGALKFTWDARVDAIRAETEQKTSENERLRKEQRDAQKAAEDRARAEAKAAQFYALVQSGKKVDMLEQYDALKKEPLSRAEAAFFADEVEHARNDLAAQMYANGQDKARQQRWQDAVSSYEESLRYKDDSALQANVHLGLAQAYRKLGRQKDAMPILQTLIETSPDKELLDDALYEMAWCEMETQGWNDAKNTWRTLLRKFPDSHYMPEAKMELASLQLLH